MSEKVCVVAGVGPGTGAALSRRFAAGGYRVAMLARDAERLAALEKEIDGSRGYSVDVTDAARVTEVVERISSELGRPSVLLHNAVSGHFGEFLQVEPEVLERTFRTNVLSLLLLGQAVVPGMLANGGGAIVVTGREHLSMAGCRELRRLRAVEGGAADSRSVDGAEPRAEGNSRDVRRHRRCDRRAVDAPGFRVEA